jgi:hypothetical protein
MATAAYINGRRKYKRPQAMLWADNPGTLVDGLYVPMGLEIGAYAGAETDMLEEFLILSDDNRSALDFTPNRIEKRERMINGRLRTYHIADKMTLSTSWENLPSRAHPFRAEFDTNGKTMNTLQYTTDGGAGGVEILDWYEKHKGSFWVYLAYDKYSNFGKDNNAYAHLPQYNELIEMTFSNFSYNVVKRGGSNFDFWNINVTLEEV